MTATRLPVGALCVILSATRVSAAKTQKVLPERAGDALVLFDVDVHPIEVIRTYTASWRKGSNLTPTWRPVRRNGAKLIEVTFAGERGMACSTIYFTRIPAHGEGMTYAGIALTADYDKDDYAKFGLTAGFSDGTLCSYRVTLEKGLKEYPLRGGFRRAKTPIDWAKLSYVMLSTSAGDEASALTYRIGRIVLTLRPEVQRARVLRPGNVKRAHEVLPLSDPVSLDARLSEGTWSAAEPLSSFHYYRGPEVMGSDSPYVVRIAYDDNRLYLATQSRFPTAPQAQNTAHDGAVFQDEAQEFFFLSRNVHTVQIQFVVNGAGAVFDTVNRDRGQSVNHEKRMAYRDRTWTTEIAFPFYDLNVDLGTQRYMEFQTAQSYRNRTERGLGTVVWSRTGKFPDSENFGLLVFNKRKFGPGSIRVEGIRRVERKDDKADFHIDCSLEGFVAGTYRVLHTIRGATERTAEESLEIPGGREIRKTFTTVAAHSRNSLYTFYLTLINARDDAKVLGVNFTNWTDVGDLFAERLFNPRPKKVEWKEGELAVGDQRMLSVSAHASARTRRTAELFAERLHGFTGRRLELRTFDSSAPRRGIILQVAKSAMVGGERTPLKPEGYALAVEPDRAVITGCDDPGLFYGTVTFGQLVKQPMRITRRSPVPCVEIVDWPDLGRRLCRLEHPHTFRDYPVKDRWGIDYLREWTDRFVADNKMNVLMVDLSACVTYKRRTEFNGREKMYSLEDLERYGEFCRDRFVDLMPAWQIGGHGTWWLLVGYHPEMREKGWGSQTDVTHPEHDGMMFDCMLDVVEALRPKYLTPKSDEWWHNRKSGEQPDELLGGKPRAQVFLDLHLKIHRWCRERGITMAMYHDMLTPYHNGKRYDTYTIIDRFPKDVVILAWSPRHVKYFAERGFPVWVNPTGMFLVPDEEKPLIQGYGKGMYSWGNHRQGLLDSYSSLVSQYCLFHGADYAWNLTSDSGEDTTAQIETGRLVALRQMFAVRPNPAAGEGFEPLDLGGVMTHRFEAFLREVKPTDYAEGTEPLELPGGAQEIGLVPMRLAAAGGNNCIVVREKAAEVAVPVGKRCSALVFLHAAFINSPQDTRARGVALRKWQYGWPVGDYVVHYAEGTQEVLPLRLTVNISRFDTSSLNRATLENRYAWALKDCNQNDIHLFQWEWVNPHPDREIARVVARHANELDVSLILVAVSGRGVRGE